MIGEEYPIAFINDILSKAVFGIQLAAFFSIFAPSTARQYLPFIPNSIFEIFERKKWLSAFLTFLIGNQVYTLIRKTGAFEISVNGLLIFSKLQTGGVPSYPDLLKLIAARGFRLI